MRKRRERGGDAIDSARRRVLRLLAAMTALPFLTARAEGLSSHHLANGTFRNTYIDSVDKPFTDLLRWRRESPPTDVLSFPIAENDPTFLAANREQTTITWIGHATFLLQINGYNILTDPHFSGRASPFSFTGPKRGTSPGLAINNLPPLDAIVISHNHYDHLDENSIAALAQKQPQTPFFVPLRLRETLVAMGAKRVVELDWGQSEVVGGLRLTAEPCQHWSARGIWDRNKTLWAAWVAETASHRCVFIGDTGYSADFADMGKKYGVFDLALIPIGAYEPRWFMQQAHIAPHESVRIFQDLCARNAVASHWGTFSLTDEPMDEPPQKLQQALAAAAIDDGRFAVFQHGQTRRVPFYATA